MCRRGLEMFCLHIDLILVNICVQPGSLVQKPNSCTVYMLIRGAFDNEFFEIICAHNLTQAKHVHTYWLRIDE